MCQSLRHVLAITVRLPSLENYNTSDFSHNSVDWKQSYGYYCMRLSPLRSALYIIPLRQLEMHCIYQCQDTVFDKMKICTERCCHLVACFDKVRHSITD